MMALKILTILFTVCIIQATGRNDPNCGSKGPKPLSDGNRLGIINGQPTKPHEYPWQCSIWANIFLQLSDQKAENTIDGIEVCACSIVNKRWVLSTANCIDLQISFFQLALQDFWFIGGLYNHSAFDGTEDIDKFSDMFMHPAYNESTFEGNLVLFKLKHDLDLNSSTSNMSSVCIPDKQPVDQIVGHDCVITGYGETFFVGDFSDGMHKASVQMWKQSDCVNAWNLVPDYNRTITNGSMCYGDHAKASTCYGDWGSPLSCYLDDRWYLYGIQAFNQLHCNASILPSVGTRVSQYSDWIWKTIENNSD